MARTKRPVMINATVTEEYVVCGVCLTKNRVVSHAKAFRPRCGHCGYPLPDPFAAQPGIRAWWEWVRRHRLAAVTAGFLVTGLLVWAATRSDSDNSGAVPEFKMEPVPAARGNEHGAPIDTISVVIRPAGPTFSRDASASESVMLVIDLAPSGIPSDSPSGADHGGNVTSISVLSHLQKTNTAGELPTDAPDVVERIHLDGGQNFSR
ncbi:MAG TPA: hypothetical protein VMV72_01695 [Verrucomicrobiae bacterium]|nr:hypothetical protein [Verrucomicrobiae bacterium]